MILDFGSARKLMPDGLTEPIDDEFIFSTPGFRAPEVYYTAERWSAATDIFSVGCLMLYLFKGKRFLEQGDSLALSPSMTAPVSVDEAIKFGYRREAARLFTKILSKALKYGEDDRYQSADEMIEDIRRLKELVAPPKFRLPANLSRNEYFVEGSRDREIVQLQSALENGQSVLYIWGQSGIGKTELAQEFARRMLKSGVDAYRVTYRNSMHDTIMSMEFSGYNYEHDGAGDADARDYRQRLEILNENYKGYLLVVDNFDHDEKGIDELRRETAYRDLIGLDMKWVFTTRSRPDDKTPELGPLDEDSTLSLFNSIATVDEDDAPYVIELIREVDCHPYAVELIAKTLNEGWRTISALKLLSLLRSDRLNNPLLPDVVAKEGERAEKIYSHIRTLFRLFNADDDYREVLAHSTLLAIDGLDAAMFLNAEDAPLKKKLRQLEKRSWLRRRKENNRLYIHPLIRTVLKNELKPTDSDCRPFLENIWRVIDDSYMPDNATQHQSAELFDRAAKDLGDPSGDYDFYAAHCLLEVGSYALASVKLGRTTKAREENLSPDDPNLANLYANIANLYLGQDDVAHAVDYARRAVKIFERTPPKLKYEHVNAYFALGHALISAKQYAEALENLHKSVTLFKQFNAREDQNLALIYRSISDANALLGNFDEAIDYVKRSIKIFEATLPAAHPDIIASYSYIANVYKYFGRPQEGNFIGSVLSS